MQFRIIYLSVQGVQEEYFTADDWTSVIKKFKELKPANDIMSISECSNTKSKLTHKGRIKVVHYNVVGNK